MTTSCGECPKLFNEGMLHCSGGDAAVVFGTSHISRNDFDTID